MPLLPLQYQLRVGLDAVVTNSTSGLAKSNRTAYLSWPSQIASPHASLPFSIGLRSRHQFNRCRFVPNCKDAVAAKRKSDCPNRVPLLEQPSVHQMSVLGIVGIYLLLISIDSRVLNGFWSHVVSDGTFAENSWPLVTMKRDLFLLGPIAQCRLL